METKRFIIDDGRIDEEKINEAARLLQAGEVVAFPTETVYGLGADATNPEAIEKIFMAKGRPSDNPLIVHVASKAQLQALVEPYPAYVDRLMEAFSPGPITYVLKSKGNVAENVTANLPTVGVRIPDSDIALALLTACDRPIAAPSANISGKPSPTKGSHVYDDLKGKIAGIVEAAPAAIGLESTVIDCTGEVPLILRIGTITKAAIEKVIGSVHSLETAEQTTEPKSPGLKYKHYAPDVPLILVQNNNNIQKVIDEKIAEGKKVGALVSNQTAEQIKATEIFPLGSTEMEMANRLYDILRSFKEKELDLVVCESLPTEGVGLAVMDRLKRAASIIK